jgi:hypothetical protein
MQALMQLWDPALQIPVPAQKYEAVEDKALQSLHLQCCKDSGYPLIGYRQSRACVATTTAQPQMLQAHPNLIVVHEVVEAFVQTHGLAEPIPPTQALRCVHDADSQSAAVASCQHCGIVLFAANFTRAEQPFETSVGAQLRKVVS